MCFTAKQCLNDFIGYGLLSVHVRYYVKCRISPAEKQKLPVEWEAYDCTRSIKLPGKPLMRELGTDKKKQDQRKTICGHGSNKTKQKETRRMDSTISKCILWHMQL
jgi:hypothetical protein